MPELVERFAGGLAREAAEEDSLFGEGGLRDLAVERDGDLSRHSRVAWIPSQLGVDASQIFDWFMSAAYPQILLQTSISICY